MSIKRLRGQGSDGAGNMQGKFNGLKTFIMKENTNAFYIHCFAHQLQLTLVVVARNHYQFNSLFNVISNVVNVVGVSWKRMDILRDKQSAKFFKEVNNVELLTMRSLN